MPGKNGTGPAGLGRGLGLGRSSGAGQGLNARRVGGNAGYGVQGYCVCPKCGAKVEHERAEPCYTKKCPSCGAIMVRE
ncbi:hypothetical protein [Acidaminobacter hydrogenoformans]|uniref:Uncharacterized protein n=1 Tax=Acidaminobacter hydrogenoformans DSM 2784 TaxID=1120920 RepID=A0A1G5S680_9FIRM|nr:hypothetical protein [Acidaminobacter hydrogenoformans]SCZ81855.1 hypothetical protein SAMN03080599_03100 [Acidaminobacter hydrogenoformans DSM 2784]